MINTDFILGQSAVWPGECDRKLHSYFGCLFMKNTLSYLVYLLLRYQKWRLCDSGCWTHRRLFYFEWALLVHEKINTLGTRESEGKEGRKEVG